MLPPQAIRHVERLVDVVGAGPQRGCTVEVAEDPVLLEPADVTDLPDRRLEEVAGLTEELTIGEAIEQLALDATRVEQCTHKGIRGERRVHVWSRPSAPRPELAAPRHRLGTCEATGLR